MLLVSEALWVANTLLRNTTQASVLGIPPEFCTRARKSLIGVRCLRAAPPAEFRTDLEGESATGCPHPSSSGRMRKVSRVVALAVAGMPVFRKVDCSISWDAHTQETAHHGVQ